MSSKNTVAKGSEKKRRIEQEKKRETVTGLAIVLIIVIAIAGAAWHFVTPLFSNPGSSSSTKGPSITGDPTLAICIDDAGALAMHIHVQLSIVANGQPVVIPANIAIEATCTRPVHTHDDKGTIHIESPVVYSFILKDFFLVWGQPFDNTQVLQYKVDSTHILRMTINGAPNNQFQNYVFHDQDQVLVTYVSTI